MPSTGKRELGAVLAATLGTQLLVSWSVLAIAAMAPAVALSVGLPAVAVGYQIAIVYAVGAAVSLIAGSLVGRLGGCRVSQLALLAAGLGCLMATRYGITGIVIASLVIGLAHGLTNPSAAHLLARHTRAHNRGVIFSLKQTGVPLGGMAAGLLTPLIAVAFGWQMALIAIAPVAVALAFLLAPRRAAWDQERDPRTPLGLGALRGAGAAFRLPGLRRLCLAAFAYAGIQLCLMSFVVTFAVVELQMSLPKAGTLLASVQAAGVIGRVAWGWVADRLENNGLVLVVIGLIAALAAAGFATIGPDTPEPLVYGLAVLFGTAAVGWNGVFVAEIVRVAPPAAIGVAAGIGSFAAFAGVLVAPPLFVQLYAVTGAYSLTFGLLAVPALVGAAATIGLGRRGPG